MMLFALPALHSQSHKIMIWGYEKTWSQNGKWDHATIAWNFEKALHETLFDRQSTKMLPPNAKSASAADILASIKKAIMTLKKIHSRDVELFCLARLQGENEVYLEGFAPAWVSLLQVTSQNQNAELHPCENQEWFSLPLPPGSKIFVVRPDVIETSHHLEISESSVCRFELLSEWLSSTRPCALGFDPEETK